MNRLQLAKKLEEIGVPSRVYSLHGASDNKTCIEQRNGKWYVFFFERGQENVIKVFDTETEACEFMLFDLKKEIP